MLPERTGPPTAEHLAGVGVGGQAPLIDAVAEMLDHQFGRPMVDLDQEIAGRIQGDEALRQARIESCKLAQLLRVQGLRSGLRHGVDRR